MDRESSAELARRIQDEVEWLAPRLPEVDHGDLIAILTSLLRPPGSGKRFFLREVRRGVYVP